MNLEEYTWHCLYCAPRRELEMCHDLWTYKLPGIVPAEKSWSDKSGHDRVAFKPVMPRYVFTGFREPPDFEKLRNTIPYLQGYMQFGSGPTVLKLEDMQWLYDLRETLMGRQKPTVVEGVIRIGDKVKVIHGPFTGQSVVVDKVVSDRIHTIREFLGAPRLFKIPLADLMQVG